MATPSNNLPASAQPWARYITGVVEKLSSEVLSRDLEIKNLKDILNSHQQQLGDTRKDTAENGEVANQNFSYLLVAVSSAHEAASESLNVAENAMGAADIAQQSANSKLAKTAPNGATQSVTTPVAFSEASVSVALKPNEPVTDQNIAQWMEWVRHQLGDFYVDGELAISLGVSEIDDILGFNIFSFLADTNNLASQAAIDAEEGKILGNNAFNRETDILQTVHPPVRFLTDVSFDVKPGMGGAFPIINAGADQTISSQLNVTGALQYLGVEVVSLTKTQTLQNKTIQNLVVTGGHREGVSTLTANATLATTASKYQIINAPNNSTPITITLPTTTTAGIEYTFKRIDLNPPVVTLAGTFDGLAGGRVINIGSAGNYKYLSVISTSTAGSWYIVGSN